MSAIIGATHVLCSIGNGTEQVWASARAGIARIRSSHVLDKWSEPIRMGLVPDEALGELTADIQKLPLPFRARRILKIAAPCLAAAAKDLEGPLRIFVGLPELTAGEAPWLRHFPAYLGHLTGLRVDSQSEVIPAGRASGLLAVERALAHLHSGEGGTAVVGGVDSFLDFKLLAGLEDEGRILEDPVMDGLIPGEGGAFLVLHQDRDATEKRIVLQAVGSAMDAGHRYGTKPATGEGLAMALEQLRQALPGPVSPIGVTFAGFNGENFDAKMRGVASLRHR